MSTPSSLLRPRDGDALRAELRSLAAAGSLPVLFGGEVDGDSLVLTEFVGTRTPVLRGLEIRSHSGLGGASMVSGKPLSVADYRRAAGITHHYDAPVVSEGIRAVLAVPVVVDGVARAVMYGAYRSSAPIAGRAVDSMMQSARKLGYELKIRDEVDRRLRLRQAEPTNCVDASVDREQIRAVDAELRRLASTTGPVPKAALRQLAERLSPNLAIDGAQVLTAREIDVLVQIGLGCTNKQVAQRLSLQPQTVKAYLRNVSAKLGTSSRYEAVTTARRLRLIP